MAATAHFLDKIQEEDNNEAGLDDLGMMTKEQLLDYHREKAMKRKLKKKLLKKLKKKQKLSKLETPKEGGTSWWSKLAKTTALGAAVIGAGYMGKSYLDSQLAEMDAAEQKKLDERSYLTKMYDYVAPVFSSEEQESKFYSSSLNKDGTVNYRRAKQGLMSKAADVGKVALPIIAGATLTTVGAPVALAAAGAGLIAYGMTETGNALYRVPTYYILDRLTGGDTSLANISAAATIDADRFNNNTWVYET